MRWNNAEYVDEKQRRHSRINKGCDESISTPEDNIASRLQEGSLETFPTIMRELFDDRASALFVKDIKEDVVLSCDKHIDFRNAIDAKKITDQQFVFHAYQKEILIDFSDIDEMKFLKPQKPIKLGLGKNSGAITVLSNDEEARQLVAVGITEFEDFCRLFRETLWFWVFRHLL